MNTQTRIDMQAIVIYFLLLLLIGVFAMYVGAYNDAQKANRRANDLVARLERSTETINQCNATAESLIADCEAYRRMITNVSVTPFQRSAGTYYTIEPHQPTDELPTEDRP